MKTRFAISVALLLFAGISHATILTISNHPAGGAQYSTLQEAYTEAIDNDTLLIEGTDIAYFLNCQADWNKSLTVIGIGFNPNKQIAKRTKIRHTECWGELRLRTDASDSRFYGIEFMNAVWTPDQGTSNLLFENCRFNDIVSFDQRSATNFAFINCIFDRDNIEALAFGRNGAAASGLISNCVFDGQINGNSSVNTSVVIEHCVFLNTTVAPFNGLHYAQISNNLFMNVFPSGSLSSDYQNNLSAVAGTFPPDPANGNTASNNIENTDPLLVAYSSGELYAPAHDYDLQPGSPAIGAANNGTDIGVHGGISNFSETGEVLIAPIVRAMNILNNSVAPNGTLNVQVHASSPNTE